MKSKIVLPTLLMLMIGCTNIKEPDFRRIEKFRIKDLGVTQGTIGLNVIYYNPNNFGVTVKETEADVYLNSVLLGKFTQDSLVTVEKGAEFSIPISGSIPLATLLQLNLNNNPNMEVLLKADGTTKIGKLGIYITKPIHYEGKQKLGSIRL